MEARVHKYATSEQCKKITRKRVHDLQRSNWRSRRHLSSELQITAHNHRTRHQSARTMEDTLTWSHTSRVPWDGTWCLGASLTLHRARTDEAKGFRRTRECNIQGCTCMRVDLERQLENVAPNVQLFRRFQSNT